MKKVNSVEELKEMIVSGEHDFFMMLNGGLRSSKWIDFHEGTFFVLNEIDGTEQELTGEELNDRNLTNIGYAINNGAFFCY